MVREVIRASCLVIALLSTSPSQAYWNEYDSEFRIASIGASVLSLLVWNPMNLESVGFDYGVDENFQRTRILWNWKLSKEPIVTWGRLEVQGKYELAVGQVSPFERVVNVGFTPILCWRITGQKWVPFIETGLGGNYLSQTEHDDRDLSSHFQFGETLGIGLDFDALEFSFRYQHLSNGDIVPPNNGYNFYGFSLSYRY